jgi:hypothetical protein
MWVIIRKSDRQVMGMSGGGASLKRDEAIEEVLRGLPEPGDISEYDTIEIEDSEEGGHLVRALFRGQASIEEGSGGSLRVVDETPEATAVAITTNAKDSHPVDNVPLIPGDGTSFIVVTLQKIVEQDRKPRAQAEDNDVIWLRTNHGSLREDKDDRPQEIRSVKLVSGTAKFRLYSENAKRLATVEMLSENRELRVPGLRVEFI